MIQLSTPDPDWATILRTANVDLAAGETAVLRAGFETDGVVLERQADVPAAMATLRTRVMVVAEPAAPGPGEHVAAAS